MHVRSRPWRYLSVVLFHCHLSVSTGHHGIATGNLQATWDFDCQVLHSRVDSTLISYLLDFVSIPFVLSQHFLEGSLFFILLLPCWLFWLEQLVVDRRLGLWIAAFQHRHALEIVRIRTHDVFLAFFVSISNLLSFLFGDVVLCEESMLWIEMAKHHHHEGLVCSCIGQVTMQLLQKTTAVWMQEVVFKNEQ